MSEREAFIRGIAANLYDDTARLAFADWLDEHGEHDRAEFIRVQVELEPMRDRYEIARAAELHARENELRKEVEWLGDMPRSSDGWSVSVEFRRGFPDLLLCSAKVFLELGAAVRERHPTVRRVVIHCLNGWGERLAACEALKGLTELELACWYADDDINALAASPHLGALQVLELWMGRQVDGTDDAALCLLAAKGEAWPNLRELVLLDPEGNDEKGIAQLTSSANSVAKREVARYERGYPELFPLNERFYRDFPVAGRLADGRAAVFALDAGSSPEHDTIPAGLLVRTFNAAGAPAEELRVPLPPELATVPLGAAENWDERYTRVARVAIGFVPGFIRVQGGALDDFGYGFGPWRAGGGWDHCGAPDDPEEPINQNGDPDPDGNGGEVYRLIHEGEFTIGYNAWADKTGHIHST